MRFIRALAYAILDAWQKTSVFREGSENAVSRSNVSCSNPNCQYYILYNIILLFAYC